MVHQSLYRRYRPSRFEQLIGQDHVVAALRNAVRDQKVGHAYLFSGPRGTGKTSTARILAKAINCQNPQEGEACDECESCQAFISGASYDLHELDAASNNKVEDMRDLISKVSFGTPGRRKVYVLDEVHMLTTGAENALLKTLEEPPEHVTFVMCTTEPHKVAETVRSRAQRLQFELVPAEQLLEHVSWVAQDAGFELSEPDAGYVVKTGRGSVRDTLSALDQVVAANGMPSDDTSLERLLEALEFKNLGEALLAVDDAINAGKEPRVIAEELVGVLRHVFLAAMGASLNHLLPQEQALAKSRSEQLPTVVLTNTLEELGEALVRMRQSTDPRIDLELAFLRLLEVAGASPGPVDGPGPGTGPPQDAAPPLPKEEPRPRTRPARQTATEPRQASETPSRPAETKRPTDPPPSQVAEPHRQAEPPSREPAPHQANAPATDTPPSDPNPNNPNPDNTANLTPGAIRRRQREARQAQPEPEPEPAPSEPKIDNATKFLEAEQARKAAAVGVSPETIAEIESVFPDTQVMANHNAKPATKPVTKPAAQATAAPEATPEAAEAAAPEPEPAPTPEPQPEPEPTPTPEPEPTPAKTAAPEPEPMQPTAPEPAYLGDEFDLQEEDIPNIPQDALF